MALFYCKPAYSESKTCPNIILIVTDDMDIDSIKKMPKLQSLLVDNGVTFTNAFVSSPVCIPSRASILKGQYMHTHGVIGAKEAAKLTSDNTTLAAILHDNGYRTAMMGKYFNGFKPKSIPYGWDEWNEIITDNVYYNYKLRENDKYVDYGNNKEDYISDVFKNKAIDFIKNSDQSHPFFLYFSTVAPHVPVISAEEFKNLFENEKISFSFEDDLSDKPAWVRNFYAKNEYFDKPFFSIHKTDTKKAEKWYRNRWRTLQSIDNSILAITDTLRDRNQINNTYIFFVSDNGGGLSKHIQVGAKLSPYEEGIHVPFIAFGPSIPKNEKRNHVVSTVDLLPTIAEIAGINFPDKIDGLSLLPVLAKKTVEKEKWRESVVVELGAIDELSWTWRSVPPMYRILRAEKYKYIEYITGEKEYYDLIADPNEMTNLYYKMTKDQKKTFSENIQKSIKWEEWNSRSKKVDIND